MSGGAAQAALPRLGGVRVVPRRGAGRGRAVGVRGRVRVARPVVPLAGSGSELPPRDGASRVRPRGGAGEGGGGDGRAPVSPG